MAKAGNILSLTLPGPVHPPDDLVVLGYTLTESPTINRAALPEVYRTEDVAWLYDELTHERVPGPPSWLTAPIVPRAMVGKLHHAEHVAE